MQRVVLKQRKTSPCQGPNEGIRGSMTKETIARWFVSGPYTWPLLALPARDGTRTGANAQKGVTGLGQQAGWEKKGGAGGKQRSYLWERYSKVPTHLRKRWGGDPKHRRKGGDAFGPRRGGGGEVSIKDGEGGKSENIK